MAGKKLFTAISDYTVIDLETCGLSSEERKKIIEISALRFRDDKLTEKFSTLVNPQIHIPDKATQTNNITDEMVLDAPNIEAVLPDFMDFIGDDVIIGHGIYNYDYNILNNLSIELLNKPLLNSYIDTYLLAKRCLPDLQNHRLETLSQHLGLPIDGMHRSEYDCVITQQLYIALKPLCGETISPKFYSPKPKTKSQYSYAQVEQSIDNSNPFLGKTCIVYGAFQQLSEKQIKGLFSVLGATYIDFFNYSADFLILGDEMHRKYLLGIEDELIDNRVALRKPIISEYDFVRYGNIIFSEQGGFKEFKVNYDVEGKTFCVTGGFDVDSRENVINRLTALGGIVRKNVIISLDYLIVGNKGSENYKDGTKGSKIEKAEKFNSNGANIQIISEKDFINTEVLNYV